MDTVVLFLVVLMELFVALLDGVKKVVGHVLPLILVHLGSVDVDRGALLANWLKLEVAFANL